MISSAMFMFLRFCLGDQLEPLMMGVNLRPSRLKVGLDGIVAPAYQISNSRRIDIPQVQWVRLCKVVSYDGIDNTAESPCCSSHEPENMCMDQQRGGIC
jgi:hypothetical protein